MYVVAILSLMLIGNVCMSSDMCIIDGPMSGGAPKHDGVNVDGIKKIIEMDLQEKNRIYHTKNDEVILYFKQRLPVPKERQNHDGMSRSMGLPLVRRVIIFTNGDNCDCFTINDSKIIGYMSISKDSAFDFVTYNNGNSPDNIEISADNRKEIIEMSDYIFKISKPNIGQ